MRQEKSRIETPTVEKALHELLVPSIPLKLIRGSETGKPDDMFLIPAGRPLFIEFKWGALQPDSKQEYWHKIFKDLGYDVQVHNDVDEALAAIAVEVVAASLYAAGGQVLVRAWRGDFNARSRPPEDFHYTCSFQFLEKAWGGYEDARRSTVESVLSSLARRSHKMGRL